MLQYVQLKNNLFFEKMSWGEHMANGSRFMELKCRAVDYDFCAATFLENGYRGLHRIYIERGVPKDIVEAVSREVDVIGFTIERFTAQIKLRPGFSSLPNEEGIPGDFARWLRRTHRLYSDSVEIVTRWRESGIKVPIVTRGNADYQEMKILSTGMPNDRIYCVEPPIHKSVALRELIAQYGSPIMFIDDRIAELDSVRDDGLGDSEVVTVWMRRSDSPYNSGVSMHRHHEVRGFAEIDLL